MKDIVSEENPLLKHELQKCNEKLAHLHNLCLRKRRQYSRDGGPQRALLKPKPHIFNNQVSMNKFPAFITFQTAGSGSSVEYRLRKKLTDCIFVYGLVTNLNDTIVIKIRKVQDDLAVMESINKSDEYCRDYIIPYKIVYYNTKPVILMEGYNGSISYLKKHKPLLFSKNMYTILIVLVKALLCLLDLGLYYTDIKLDNMLYKKLSGKTLDFVLGDLGSAYKEPYKGITYSRTTFPPFNKRSYKGLLYDNPKEYPKLQISESDLSWGVGMFIAGMFDLKFIHNNYWYKNVKNMTHKEHKNNIDTLVNWINFPVIPFNRDDEWYKNRSVLEEILVSTLNQDPNKRPTLEQILHRLSNPKKLWGDF